jgi:glycolate oxidase
VNILKGNLSEQAWQEELPKAIRMLFESVVTMGGTLSGEHGIGWVQKPYMDIAFSPRHLELMRGIKLVFDQQGILNPQKILPSE